MGAIVRLLLIHLKFFPSLKQKCRNNHVAVAVERRTQLDVGTLGRIGGIFKIDVYLLALHSRCNVANVISTAVLLFLGSSVRGHESISTSTRIKTLNDGMS